jgi:hypothetical protein
VAKHRSSARTKICGISFMGICCNTHGHQLASERGKREVSLPRAAKRESASVASGASAAEESAWADLEVCTRMVAAMHAHGSSAHVGAEVGALVAGRVRARTRWRALCAARFPVGRRQGRGLGQACAGVRGEFARTAGVGRGELGANVGMAHFWRSWMRGWSQSERSRSASADFALSRAIRVSSLGSGPSSVRYRVSKRGQLWVLL